MLTRRSGLAFLPALALPLLARPALAAPRIGAAAPDFTATDSNGRTVSLAALRGKVVVLEWTNDGCPFVAKWYRAGAMQQLQRDATARGAVWLSVISSAPGEQGYADGTRANDLTRSRNAAPTHVLLDPTGTLGHLYGAETTPHVFVITPTGTLAYMGGADSIASTRVEDLTRAEPYAREAITAVLDNRPVARTVTRPYGCTVKYAS
ncbi:redoxin domain-containing protein [Rhodovastum atsumiense]|uniref:Redoxin domain-containing protein n=2 Tax=Rhodovastum atsumiense TaxID=504468 RepID=A0A5M6ITK5_9PROT|nr:redoxin domain-containing protein [Rhodovastum atsumiense]